MLDKSIITFNKSESDKIIQECHEINKDSVRYICSILVVIENNKKINIEYIKQKYAKPIKTIKSRMRNNEIASIVFNFSINSKLLKSLFFKG